VFSLQLFLIPIFTIVVPLCEEVCSGFLPD